MFEQSWYFYLVPLVSKLAQIILVLNYPDAEGIFTGGNYTKLFKIKKFIERTELIRYIPNETLMSEETFFKVQDYYGAQVRKNGKWNDEEDYPAKPIIFPPYFYNFTCKMALLKNVYINWASGVLTNEHFIIPDENNWFVSARAPSSGPVVARYENAIAVGRESNRYGHWILDYMCPLLLLPENVIKTYTILNVPDIPIAHEMLNWLGVPKKNIVHRLMRHQLVFCRNVYFPYKPLVDANYIGYPVQLIRDLVFKTLKLDGINQTKYCFYQRAKKRVILNLNEMINMTKINFPEYPWETIPDGQSLTQCGKTWAAIKLIISGNGSHMFRCVCMQKGAVYIEILGPYNDLSCLGAVLSTGTHVITIKTNAITMGMWWSGKNYKMEIDKVINAIKYVKPYLDGQPFPSGPLLV